VLVYQQLIEHGFRNLRHYAGGIADWEDAGYPLEGERVNQREEKRTTNSPRAPVR
jgi:3-mercaptopyruvate sulfurtransferase SseA